MSIRDNIAVVGAPGYQENKGNILFINILFDDNIE